MRSKLSLFIILLSISLYGCADNAGDNVWPAQQSFGKEFLTYKPPIQTHQDDYEDQVVTEPNGTLTLSQAHALALIHNPQLRAFAWEVRAAEARQLQASLPPNPEINAEMEEVAGSGNRRRS